MGNNWKAGPPLEVSGPQQSCCSGLMGQLSACLPGAARDAGTLALLCWPMITDNILLTNLKQEKEGQGREPVAWLQQCTHNTQTHRCRDLPSQETASRGQGPCSTQANGQLALGATQRGQCTRAERCPPWNLRRASWGLQYFGLEHLSSDQSETKSF